VVTNGKPSYKLPLFIRDKSIIPTRVFTEPTQDMRLENLPDAYNILVYSKDGQDAESFVLYEDDGISYKNPSPTFYNIQFKNGKVHITVTGVTRRKPKFNSFLNSSKSSIPTSIEYHTQEVKPWSPLTPAERKARRKSRTIMWIIIGVAILVIVVLIILAFFLFGKKKKK
jgi:alpha-glucosidase (family GH31 glycosyl hydrolase)